MNRHCLTLLVILLLACPSLAVAQASKPATSQNAKIDALLAKLGQNKTAKSAKAELLALDRAGYQILKNKAEAAQRDMKTRLNEVLKQLRRTHKIWDFKAREKAEAYLKNNPKRQLMASPQSQPKVCKLVGELKHKALSKVFPYHRFFEFELAVFSGRLNPHSYVAVSIDGEVTEFKVFEDFGVDSALTKMFQAEAQVKGKDEKHAALFMEAFLALQRSSKKPNCKLQKDKQGGLAYSSIPGRSRVSVRFYFDKTGALKELTFKQ